ncbi:FAD-dependent oxidoreductase [Sinomicrobium pectinilyticum]|uniref:FAD-dependent oxidoreductase n=1 Tax=Sinomicrobium pectinilyticum TaxID=1084421 RepID=A0A3N0E3S9_SINP1|nr:FAD-dependent oxidoreductase [Sinomicrobium pectinilyticum]RNL82496.1 FAD-dependent oxidoreductase [Sinomicrobium pectinilyticum]
MKRRDMLTRIGVLSLGMAMPGLSQGEILKKPYKIRFRTMETDILVVGGGTAGAIAAIQAGRAGQKVTLLECQSQLGGTTTTAGVAFPGIFHAWGKQVISGIGWEIVQEAVALNGDTLPDFSMPHGRQHWRHQIRLNGQLYSMLLEQKCIDAGVEIRYYETPTQITFRNDHWLVETVGKGIHVQIRCRQIIDCSGNAIAASIAGFDLIREKETQPGTLMFTLEGYDMEKLDLNLIRSAYNDAVSRGELVRSEFRGDIVALLKTKGDNIQHIKGADSTTSESHTQANIMGRTSLYKHLKFLKKLPGCENIRIADMRTEVGVRETYRIDGLYRVTREDYVTGRVFKDAVSYSYYPIDLHTEHGVTPRHLAEGVVATVPLRSLIPKNSKNFIVAGRCLSSDRLANSALRVQASCMGMGQAAAAATILANQQNISPGEVDMDDLRKLLEQHGGIVPKS